MGASTSCQPDIKCHGLVTQNCSKCEQGEATLRGMCSDGEVVIMPTTGENFAEPSGGAHLVREGQHNNRQKYTNLFGYAKETQMDDMRAVAAEVDAQVRALNANAWLSDPGCKEVTVSSDQNCKQESWKIDRDEKWGIVLEAQIEDPCEQDCIIYNMKGEFTDPFTLPPDRKEDLGRNAVSWNDLKPLLLQDAISLNQTGELACCKDDDVVHSKASLEICETSENSCKQEAALLDHRVEPNIREDDDRELSSVGPSQSTCESSQHSAREPCDTARSAGQPEEEPGAEPPPAAEIVGGTLHQASMQEDDAPRSPPMKLFHISDALEACADDEEFGDSATTNTRRAFASQSTHSSQSRQQQKDDRSQTRRSKRSRADLLLW